MIDISEAKRSYYKSGKGLKHCPECGAGLLEESFPSLLSVKSKTGDTNSITTMTGSHFCLQCPVVVFDRNQLEPAAQYLAKGDNGFQYLIIGMVDLAAIPPEKKHLPIGNDENPVPLVRFLPGLPGTIVPDLPRPIYSKKNQGRNETCLCGSGRKYKHCCGK